MKEGEGHKAALSSRAHEPLPLQDVPIILSLPLQLTPWNACLACAACMAHRTKASVLEGTRCTFSMGPHSPKLSKMILRSCR